MRNPSTAIYAGSFDPLTLAHEDLVGRALRVADRVVVAVAENPSQVKQGLFSPQERCDLIRDVFSGEPRVQVECFSGLLSHFAAKMGGTYLLRGVRNSADLAYELPMAEANRSQPPHLETLLMPTSSKYVYTSSSLVRELARLGGDIQSLVSPRLLQAVQEKLRK